MNTLPAPNAAVRRQRSRRKFILGVGSLLFVVVACVAFVICQLRAEYITQVIHDRQRDIQQGWLDKSLDAIRVWRNELLRQARYISASDMFRLFVMDASDLDSATLSRIADPESLNSEDETVRDLAEQLTYMQDLLKDFTQRRAWTDARVVRADGTALVAPEFAAPLTPEQIALVRHADESNETTFGPLRQGEDGLIMDMADPLFELQSGAEPQTVGVLLLSVPMDKPLAGFLARTGEHEETLLPRIVNPGHDGTMMALNRMGRVQLEPVPESFSDILEQKAFPFMRRPALDGQGEVYSLGARPAELDWRFILETPAAEVDKLISDQKWQIYGLGMLVSLGIALFGVIAWTKATSRSFEARARQLATLYTTIRNQKRMLDSVNSSLEVGLVLVDSQGRVQMSNPAFDELTTATGEIAPGTPLVELLPGATAVKLLGDMARVNDSGEPFGTEIAIVPGGAAPESDAAASPAGTTGDGGRRLFRVGIYPYGASEEEELPTTGCVATLKDITIFRRNADRARQRQIRLISALVHAIESVDSNLVGHSDRMARAVGLLADELNLSTREKDTLNFAARLSQIGKIFVPRHLLTKSGELTPEELEEVRRAPEYADNILEDMDFGLPVRETVREMGERMDGSGSPDGLRGDQISRCGRVLAVVNAFVAMTSPRAWRDDNGMDPDEAVAELTRDPGFDQEIVNALARVAVAAKNGTPERS